MDKNAIVSSGLELSLQLEKHGLDLTDIAEKLRLVLWEIQRHGRAPETAVRKLADLFNNGQRPKHYVHTKELDGALGSFIANCQYHGAPELFKLSLGVVKFRSLLAENFDLATPEEA